MPKTTSDDLKTRIPILYHEGYSVKTICHLLGLSKSLVYKVLSQYQRSGSVSNPHKYSCTVGRPRSLGHADHAFLSAVIHHRSSIYLDKLRNKLLLKRNVQTTLSTLSCTLQHLGITHKLVSSRASERNELLRAAFVGRVAGGVPDSNMLVFIDEAARDECTISRRYGRSHRGLRCVARRPFIRGTRYSILPALTLDGIIAYDIIEGPVDTERFVKFLKEQVMPFTNPYPGPRSVLVMDNCRIHHGEEVRRLVKEDNLCKVFYLPAYLPDYNPIEQAFSTLKAYLRRHSHDSPLMLGAVP